jgi:hypothetical protein
MIRKRVKMKKPGNYFLGAAGIWFCAGMTYLTNSPIGVVLFLGAGIAFFLACMWVGKDV